MLMSYGQSQCRILYTYMHVYYIMYVSVILCIVDRCSFIQLITFPIPVYNTNIIL